jgi:hypothetical protein
MFLRPIEIKAVLGQCFGDESLLSSELAVERSVG